jgi:hypothetical protein
MRKKMSEVEYYGSRLDAQALLWYGNYGTFVRTGRADTGLALLHQYWDGIGIFTKV